MLFRYTVNILWYQDGICYGHSKRIVLADDAMTAKSRALQASDGCFYDSDVWPRRYRHPEIVTTEPLLAAGEAVAA